jgi:hypothetical protein
VCRGPGNAAALLKNAAEHRVKNTLMIRRQQESPLRRNMLNAADTKPKARNAEYLAQPAGKPEP